MFDERYVESLRVSKISLGVFSKAVKPCCAVKAVCNVGWESERYVKSESF